MFKNKLYTIIEYLFLINAVTKLKNNGIAKLFQKLLGRNGMETSLASV